MQFSDRYSLAAVIASQLVGLVHRNHSCSCVRLHNLGKATQFGKKDASGIISLSGPIPLKLGFAAIQILYEPSNPIGQ